MEKSPKKYLWFLCFTLYFQDCFCDSPFECVFLFLFSGESHSACLGANDQGAVVRLRERVEHFEGEVAEERGPDGLDLQVAKLLAQANVAAAAKANERKLDSLVLFTWLQPTVRVVFVGVFPIWAFPSGQGRGCEQRVSLGHGVSTDLLLHEKFAHQKDDRGVKAEGLEHAGVEERHVLERLVGQVLAVLLLVLLLLLQHALQDLGVVHQEESGPRAGDGAGVLTGEQHGNHHPCQLGVGHLAAVFVLLLHERLQSVLVLDVGVRSPFLDDFGEKIAHFKASGIASSVGRGGGVAPKHCDGGQSFIQTLKEFCNLAREPLTNVITHESATGSQDDQLGQLITEKDNYERND